MLTQRLSKIDLSIALFFFLLTGSISPVPVLAQGSAVQIPVEAGQAIAKGLLAAQQQDWKLAIRYFEEARKAAPLAPQIFFDLGLAESKIPGRELRAMTWFRGYLELVPKAANAPQVRGQLNLLEVAVESTMGKIIDQAKQMITKFPDENTRYRAQAKVAVAQIKSGDMEGGKQTGSTLPRKEASHIQDIALAWPKRVISRGPRTWFIPWRISPGFIPPRLTEVLPSSRPNPAI
jgi:hypothetical protein